MTIYPGIRSGAEASSPTGDSGCLGIAGWRRSVVSIRNYDRPPMTRPLFAKLESNLVRVEAAHGTNFVEI